MGGYPILTHIHMSQGLMSSNRNPWADCWRSLGDTLEVDMPHCDLSTIHSIEGNHGSFQNFENGQYFQLRKFNDLISFAIVASYLSHRIYLHLHQMMVVNPWRFPMEFTTSPVLAPVQLLSHHWSCKHQIDPGWSRYKRSFVGISRDRNYLVLSAPSYMSMEYSQG